MDRIPSIVSSGTRRDFLRSALLMAALGGVTRAFHPAVPRALADTLEGVRPPVFWLQGMGCTGCSVSLLNALHPKIAEVLLHVIRMDFHPTLMADEGEGAISFLRRMAAEHAGGYVVVLEGAVSDKENGRFCIIGESGHEELALSDMLPELAANAAVVLAVGTCAAYGGITAARGSVTGAMGAAEFLKRRGVVTPVINLPGCPAHPDWIVGTMLVFLDAVEREGLAGGAISLSGTLDRWGRPRLFYGNLTHEQCPYLYLFDEGRMCSSPLDKFGCRYSLGCKGPVSWCDSPSRRWNGRVNWCVEASLCIGCVEHDFPDGQSPFFTKGIW